MKLKRNTMIKVAKLILAMPTTNALSERSFSALRRLKTWLHTTPDQVHLNSCMTLHVASYIRIELTQFLF